VTTVAPELFSRIESRALFWGCRFYLSVREATRAKRFQVRYYLKLMTVGMDIEAGPQRQIRLGFSAVGERQNGGAVGELNRRWRLPDTIPRAQHGRSADERLVSASVVFRVRPPALLRSTARTSSDGKKNAQGSMRVGRVLGEPAARFSRLSKVAG
jgi:hypothetical protein